MLRTVNTTVKLTFQETKENEALYQRIFLGKYMKSYMLPPLHSKLCH